MSFYLALRLTEVLFGLALLQQCAEHLSLRDATSIQFIPRAVLSAAIVFSFQTDWALLALCIHSVVVLHRYDGPYNGGSDRMGLLILYCLTLSHWLPVGPVSQAAFGYLAAQVILSYFISGYVKIINPEWRSGRALRDVFSFSAYPVANSLRHIAEYPRLMWAASWAVLLFEVLFPLSFLNATCLALALVVAMAFHLINACLFGLNRFVWVWIASYPSLIWLHGRLIQSA